MRRNMLSTHRKKDYFIKYAIKKSYKALLDNLHLNDTKILSITML